MNIEWPLFFTVYFGILIPAITIVIMVWRKK